MLCQDVMQLCFLALQTSILFFRSLSRTRVYYLWGIARPCITSHFSCLLYCIFVIPLCVYMCVFVSLFGFYCNANARQNRGAVNTLAYLDTCVYECVCLSDLILLGNCVWIVAHPITKLNLTSLSIIWRSDCVKSRLKVFMHNCHFVRHDRNLLLISQ